MTSQPENHAAQAAAGWAVPAKDLAALTAWSGEAPEVWRKALKAAEGREVGRVRIWARPVWRKIAASAAILVVVVIVSALMLPGLDRARFVVGDAEPLRAKPQAPALRMPLEIVGVPEETRRGDVLGKDLVGDGVFDDRAGAGYSHSYVLDGVPSSTVPSTTDSPDGRTVMRAQIHATDGGVAAFHADQEKHLVQEPPGALPRQVIRKATIELLAGDVRAVFLKAGLIINEAAGEYIEDSALTGTGKEAQANLTLRVDAGRLDKVLNTLRDLGEVRSERVEGQDVTAQVVDVEARLRNEQRVETELLQLLEKRQDAPLKEVLELRDKIGQIRQEIERLTAQRDRLGRLVALATVLVIIRPSDAPVHDDAGLLAYFSGVCKSSWTAGVRFLADSLATLLSLLIGGLVWWVLLIVAILLVRRYLRRRSQAK